MSQKFEISRRKFLENLGLGIGASVLSPIAGSLFNEAFAQSVKRHKFIIAIVGEAWPRAMYPTNFRNEITTTHRATGKGGIPLTKTFDWPTLLAPLAAYRNNALFLDGFGFGDEVMQTQHSMGFAPLADVPSVNEGPASITFDQYLARNNVFSSGVPRNSILFGCSENGAATEQTTFASGDKGALHHMIRASKMKSELFMGGTTTASTASTAEKANDKRILDHLRTDITKLQSKLAQPEKEKLDQYLASLDSFDKKNSSTVSCGDYALPSTAMSRDAEFVHMIDMAGMALNCGMSNVAAFAVATGGGHGMYPDFSFFKKSPDGAAIGGNGPDNGTHNTELYQTVWHPTLMDFMARMIARMLTRISGVSGKMPDDTTVLFMPSNGTTQSGHHHGLANHFPTLVLSSNPRLLSGGHFRQYERGTHRLGALYSTLAEAHGIATPGFGRWNKGAIKELLVG